METELHFLTTCPNYTQIRETFFPQFTNQHKDFNQIQQKDKLPYILEKPQQALTWLQVTSSPAMIKQQAAEQNHKSQPEENTVQHTHTDMTGSSPSPVSLLSFLLVLSFYCI